MAPIMLSDQQWDALFHACRPLPPDTRDAFVRALANRLSGESAVGDGQLARAIQETLKQFWRPPPPDKPPNHTRKRVGAALL
jgi:hypothetical protein